MRRFLLALMIALLPLRGWVGDVMAMEQVSSTHAGAQATGSATHDGHDVQPCHGHADVPLATSIQHDDNYGDCAGCVACQICHSVALTGLVPLASTAAQTSAPPQARTLAHASAERVRGFKPPIS